MKCSMVQIKNNLAGFGHAKAFALSEEGFEWMGDYEISADEVLGGIVPKVNKKDKALQFLREMMAPDTVVPSEEVVVLAKEEGIAKRTLESAKKELGIRAKRIAGKWYWDLSSGEE